MAPAPSAVIPHASEQECQERQNQCQTDHPKQQVLKSTVRCFGFGQDQRSADMKGAGRHDRDAAGKQSQLHIRRYGLDSAAHGLDGHRYHQAQHGHGRGFKIGDDGPQQTDAVTDQRGIFHA